MHEFNYNESRNSFEVVYVHWTEEIPDKDIICEGIRLYLDLISVVICFSTMLSQKLAAAIFTLHLIKQ